MTVKLLILCLFIFRLIQGNIETSIYWNFVAETGSGLKNYINVLKETSFYKPAIILLIPLIGIFINKKIGWILIQAYFYFLISNLIFSAEISDLTDSMQFTALLVIFLIIVFFIILMSLKKIANQVYGITKSKLIIYNIIASIFGMSMTIILALIKATEI